MSRRMIPDSATIGLWRLDEPIGVPSFAPTDLSGCQLWLDGQDASTFNTGSPSEGVTIDNWNDKSGNSRHANVKGNTPNYTATAINGYPGAHFDGSEYLHTTYTFGAPPFTFFVVARYGTGSQLRVVGGDGNKLFGWWNGYLGNYYYEGWVENANLTADTNAHVVCCTMRSDNTADFWWDGKLRKLLASGGSGSSAVGAIWVGSTAVGEYSDCYVGEVILYNRILDPNETARVTEYLNRKWNVYAADVGSTVLPGIIANSGPPTRVAVTDMQFSYARQFASTQAIEIVDTAILKPTSVSVEAWINWNGLTASYQYIAGRQFNGSNWDGYVLRINSAGKLEFYVKAGGDNWLEYDITGLATGWHYVVGTRDSTNNQTRLFLDAVLVAYNNSWSGNIGYSYTIPFAIGNHGGGSRGYYFNGKIAEVRLSSRARAPWEIYNTWKGLQVRDPVSGFGV